MEVQVDFAFFDPEEIDYHAIKNFLLPFLEGQAFNAGDLADLIIKQNEYVGTVVKVEGEDETYGFVSVVNLHKHKVRVNMPRPPPPPPRPSPSPSPLPPVSGLADESYYSPAVRINAGLDRRATDQGVPLVQGTQPE
jgi:hypothetical protein